MATGTNFDQWDNIFRYFYGGFIVFAALLALAFVSDVASARLSRAAHIHGRRPRLRPRFYTLRQRLQLFLRETTMFYYVSLFRFVLNLFICAAYVAGTYRRSVSGIIRVANAVIGTIFAIDVVVCTSVADSALNYSLSLSIFLQAMSLPSMLLAAGENGYLNFSFLRAFPLYECYRAIERRVGFNLIGANKSFVMRLFAKFFTLMYLLAAGVQLLEIPGNLVTDEFVGTWAALGDWHFLTAVYYVVVTIATVGTF
jgi:hypothetical protein